MFRLAHISDIHLGPLPKLSLRELASKRITGYLNWHRNRAKHLFGGVLESLIGEVQRIQPDHLAITGDMVNLATKTEIEAAKLWLEEAGTPQNTSLVPGNHDAYVPGAYKRACEAWRPWMIGDEALVSKKGSDKLFPYLRVRDNVALIGTSSANPMPPFIASGIFSRRQARQTVKLLQKAREDGLFRVVMIHHPPVRDAAAWSKRLIGIRRFGAVIRAAGAELVIHGHTHLDTVHWLKGTGGSKVPVVGIASASQGPGAKKPASGYNLFSISGEPGAWQCTREHFRFNGVDAPFKRVSEESLY